MIKPNPDYWASHLYLSPRERPKPDNLDAEAVALAVPGQEPSSLKCDGKPRRG